MTPRSLHAVDPSSTADDPSGTLTYERRFGLQEKAFSLSADPRFLYRSRAHALAFRDLSAAIRRREGLIVLTGDVGTGKTTLCRSVLQSLDRRTFSAFVADPFLSREDLLKILLVEFGVVSLADLNAGRLQGATRQDLSYCLYEFLGSLVPLQAFAVLVIDEAQNLTLPLLEEVRILSDREAREKLLQVVLVGQPELRSRLKLAELRQVDQRVTMRCELTALDRDEIASYIEHRLNVASGGASTVAFSPEALDATFAASGGVPRLINVICDRALHEASGLHLPQVDAALVRTAIDAIGLDVTPARAPAEPGIGLIALDDRSASEQIAGVAAPPSGPPVPPMRPVQTHKPLVPPDSAAGPPAKPSLPVIIEPDSVVDAMNAFRSEDETGGESGTAEGRRSFWRRWVMATAFLVAMTSVAASAALYSGRLVDELVGPVLLPSLPPPPALASARTVGPDPRVVQRIDEGLRGIVNPAAALEGRDAAGGFVIEVALFASPERADNLVFTLQERGYPAATLILRGGSGRQFVQVLAGAFATRAEADSALADIRSMPGLADARMKAPSGQPRQDSPDRQS